MRPLVPLVFVALAAAPLAAQAPRKPPAAAPAPAKPAAREANAAGALPAGWSARTDHAGEEKDVKFSAVQDGYHVTLGPATILYRNADAQQGAFQVRATITQTRASAPPEGYGLFIGGQGLAGDAPHYTYFLIRGDGQYIIKRRDGASTQNITSSWARHPAILPADANGKATNTLEVQVTPAKIAFVVNAKEVYAADPRLIDAKGVVGLRANHNLDLHLDAFAVAPQK
jgi:hypothetical protein